MRRPGHYQLQTGHHPAVFCDNNGRCRCIAPGLISIDRAREDARGKARVCARCEWFQRGALKPTDILIDELHVPKGLPVMNERDDPESLPHIVGAAVIFEDIVWHELRLATD
jgi:hypothetical protein